MKERLVTPNDDAYWVEQLLKLGMRSRRNELFNLPSEALMEISRATLRVINTPEIDVDEFVHHGPSIGQADAGGRASHDTPAAGCAGNPDHQRHPSYRRPDL